jgi:acyl dehydratase
VSATESAPRSAFDSHALTRAGFPLISFDELVIGEEFRSDDCLLRPQDIEAYAFSVDDFDPWFFAPGPFGGSIAHPTLLANQALMMRHSRYVVPAGLHARMLFDFVKAIPLGVRARTLGRVAEKYMRRDKPYMVTEFTTESEASEPFVKGRFVQMLFKDKKAPASGSSVRTEVEAPTFDGSITKADGRGGQLEVGQVLPALERSPSQRQIDVYSGVKPLSIHTDVSWAQAKGLRTTIAQGMMSTAYVSTIMTTAVGEGFVVGGQMDARFLRPVFCDDGLTVTGSVAGFSRDAERVRVHVDISAHNNHGEQTLAVTASALCY